MAGKNTGGRKMKIMVDVPDGDCCIGCDFLNGDKCLAFKDELIKKHTSLYNTTYVIDFYKHSECIVASKSLTPYG
jgi:hypothetical protein